MVELKKGDKAPDFQLPDQDGRTRSLSEFAGARVLVYFYPKANTPGCTTQACAVRDAADELEKSDVHAVGISPDSPKKQKNFDSKYDLGFPLLADEDNAVAEAYGVWGEKSMYGKKYMGIIRSAFLIGADGTIQEAWYKISPKDTVPSVLASL
jgi:peroxiredoxin Q/BCP